MAKRKGTGDRGRGTGKKKGKAAPKRASSKQVRAPQARRNRAAPAAPPAPTIGEQSAAEWKADIDAATKASELQAQIGAAGASKPPLFHTDASACLFGQVLEEDATHLKFAVLNFGDAVHLGLCGEHWFAKRQVFRRGTAEGYDVIRVSWALAALKAKTCQVCD